MQLQSLQQAVTCCRWMRRLMQRSVTLSCAIQTTKQDLLVPARRRKTHSAQSWQAVSRGRALHNWTCTEKQAGTRLPGCGTGTHPHPQLPWSRAAQMGLESQKQSEAEVAAGASSAAGWTGTCLCSQALPSAAGKASRSSATHMGSSSMVRDLSMIMSMITQLGTGET